MSELRSQSKRKPTMKNRLIRHIFFLLLWICAIYPQNSFARECNVQELEKGAQVFSDQAKVALNNFKSTVNTFNNAAKNYISKCKTPAKKKAFKPDVKVAARARNLGYNYANSSNWTYTGYNWDQETALAKDNCPALLQAVKTAKASFDDANNKAYRFIYASLNPAFSGCTCDDNGGAINCQMALTSSAEQLNSEGTGACKQFTEYQQELNICPLCPVFVVILKTIAGVSSVAWQAVAGPLTNVVKVFFLVLLAFEVLKAVAAMGGSKISAFAKGVMLLSLKIAITVLLLSSPKYIYGYFLSPVIEGGLNMGLAMANATGAGANIVTSDEDKIQIPSDTFDESVYNSVMSTVRGFGKAASTLPAIGRGLTCNAWDAGKLGLPNIGMWLSGVVMYVFGLMIWLAISFYMIDCTVQIGMLSGLVPLLVACWPFKLTEAYTFKGCKMLMNSFFSYVMLGVILLLGTMITTQAATADGSNINDIIRAINENDLDTLKEMCSLDAFQLLVLGSCCIFALKLVGQVNSLADQFSKGSGSQIGNKMGGLATGAATNAAKSAVKTGGKIAGSAVKHTAAATGATAMANKGIDKVRGGWQKGWAKAGQKVGLGKYQNQQTGSGKEGDGKENKQDNQNNSNENENSFMPIPDNLQDSGGEGVELPNMTDEDNEREE